MATQAQWKPTEPLGSAADMPVPWHRLLGIALMYYLKGSPWRVEAEVDTTVRKNLIDIVITRSGAGDRNVERPDGLEDLAQYNAMSFKSVAESLDVDALVELIVYAGGYRKLLELIDAATISIVEMRLFAVCVHYPQELFRQVPPRVVGPGIYELDGFGITVRVLVTREFPKAPRNVVWNLFSGKQDLVESAVVQLLPQLTDWSSVLNLLLARYQMEGITMPYTEADFMRDVIKRIPVADRLAGIPPAEVLKAIPPADRLAGIPPADRLAGIPPGEVLKAIPPAELRKYLAQLEKAAPRTKPKAKGKTRPREK